MPRLDALLAGGAPARPTSTPASRCPTIRDRVVSANAYLGSRPIVEALRQGADVVITGRVADASLTVGPAVHEFGWAWDDWDRLAGGDASRATSSSAARRRPAGCGATGRRPDLADVGYPIAEIAADGSFTVTKPPGTGGAVNRETVAEQLLYEVGDPAAYLTPDVVADFTTRRAGRDAAATWCTVDGARGKPAADGSRCRSPTATAGPRRGRW